jgi:hypothetical protein
MPAPKKALSPASRAKADKRNERDKAARAAKAAASGGTKSGKKRKATTDLAEEEMPTSRGGSWKRGGELLFALLEEKQKRHFEGGGLELAEGNAAFHEGPLGPLFCRAGGRRGSPAARRKWLPRRCRREPRREASGPRSGPQGSVLGGPAVGLKKNLLTK